MFLPTVCAVQVGSVAIVVCVKSMTDLGYGYYFTSRCEITSLFRKLKRLLRYSELGVMGKYIHYVVVNKFSKLYIFAPQTFSALLSKLNCNNKTHLLLSAPAHGWLIERCCCS